MKKSIKICGIIFGVVVLLLASFALYINYLLSQPAPKGFPILEYHMVQKETPIDAPEYNVLPEEFEKQLDYLQENGYTTISIRDYLRARKGLWTLPEKPVILTFDDGYESNYTELLPILERRGLKATIFVITNKIGKDNYMSWDQLKDIQRRGVEIGSHTANHIPLTELSLDKVGEELQLSKLLMEWNGMETIYTFSYPNGKYSIEHIALLRRMEYLAAVTGDSGLNDEKTTPYLLQRINIPNPHFGIDEFKWRLLKARIMTQLGINQHRAK